MSGAENFSVARDIVTMVGIIFAAYKVSHEVTAWRTQKRATARAEAAAGAIIATIRMAEHLKNVRTLVRIKRRDSDASAARTPEERLKQRGERLRRLQTERWHEFDHSVGNGFIEAWEKAQVYLDDEVLTALDKLWEKKAEIWAAQSTAIMLLLQGNNDKEIFLQGFGPPLDDELDALKDEALKLLKPIAQLREKN